MSTYNEAFQKAQNSLQRLSRFKAIWYPDKSLRKFMEQMESHFSSYKEVWLTGHFSNSFVVRIKDLPSRYPGCDFRVLSLHTTNNRNLESLKLIKKAGGQVKMHRTLHARMFIGYNEETDTNCLIIGTFDYTREGYGGENVNASLLTHNPEIIKQARDFFLEEWNSEYAQDIVV